MSIYISEQHYGASDNILNFICYYHLARYLDTDIYFDWPKSFVNFPLKSQYRKQPPSGTPLFNYEYFFTNLDKENFIKTLRGKDFRVNSMDCTGVPLLTYLFPKNIDHLTTVASTTKLFFDEYCEIDQSAADAVRNQFANSRLIGVHMRYGDSIIAGEEWRAYEKVIGETYALLKSHIREPSNIFLASDYEKKELTDYVKSIIGLEHNYVSYESEPKHSCHTVYNKSDWDELIFHMMLLSKCDTLYISPNSNVSRLAVFYAYSKNHDLEVYYLCPFTKTIERVKGVPIKKYNAWKFDGKW